MQQLQDPVTLHKIIKKIKYAANVEGQRKKKEDGQQERILAKRYA